MKFSKVIYAIIVAAGKGHRFGADVPKQFCLLGGRPLLMTTIERVSAVVGRENILLVLDSEMESYWEELCKKYDFESPRVVYGGATRQQSVENALNTLVHEGVDDSSTIMIHDGARPLATIDLFKALSLLQNDADGMIPVVPMVDSMRELIDGSTKMIDRCRYVAVQTPQVFHLGTIRKAYEAARGVKLTDDASVAEYAGFKDIRISLGEPTNIKITNPMDLVIAEAILSHQNATLSNKNKK